MYKKILVPVDGSQLSECSLEHVTQMVTVKDPPEVVLFHVMETIPHPHGPQFGESEIRRSTPDEMDDVYRHEREKTESEAKEYLNRLVNMLKKDGISVSMKISRGDPAEEILKYANILKAEIIVMSTHGRSGVTRWAFGSVADRVIRNATVPVLIAVPKGCRIK
jgi:nucleotide-binding universal stress UspA family protein